MCTFCIFISLLASTSVLLAELRLRPITAGIWIGLTNPDQIECSSLLDCSGSLRWVDGSKFVFHSWMEDLTVSETGPNYMLGSRTSAKGLFSDPTAFGLCQMPTSQCGRGECYPSKRLYFGLTNRDRSQLELNLINPLSFNCLNGLFTSVYIKLCSEIQFMWINCIEHFLISTGIFYL